MLAALPDSSSVTRSAWPPPRFNRTQNCDDERSKLVAAVTKHFNTLVRWILGGASAGSIGPAGLLRPLAHLPPPSACVQMLDEAKVLSRFADNVKRRKVRTGASRGCVKRACMEHPASLAISAQEAPSPCPSFPHAAVIHGAQVKAPLWKRPLEVKASLGSNFAWAGGNMYSVFFVRSLSLCLLQHAYKCVGGLLVAVLARCVLHSALQIRRGQAVHVQSLIQLRNVLQRCMERHDVI